MILAINTTLQLLTLRSLMTNTSIVGPTPIDAYLIPLADAHYGSRIADCDKRLQYISGFSGSAGSAVVTASSALLWTDGRYFTQAGLELDENWELMREGVPETPTQGEYLRSVLPEGSLVGVDPWLYSKSDWDALEASLRQGALVLAAVENNLVDIAWIDQESSKPPCPLNPVFHLEDEYTGQTSNSKLTAVKAAMAQRNSEALVLSELDEIAWLLNLRGSDLSSASVFISYVIVLENEFRFFINSSKLNQNVTNYITLLGGTVYPYESVSEHLENIINSTEGKIWASNKCNYALVRLIPPLRQIVSLTPIAMMKAVKNSKEVEGMRNGLIRDAAAVCRFLCWLENAMLSGEHVDELSAAQQLYGFRKNYSVDMFLSTSFTTISASGENGAVIHYRPSVESNRNLSTNEMYLVDSGAIYRDSTTDITRTVHFGTPTDFEREAYTRVLKGQIAIVTSKFPKKTTGSRLDSFARRALWNVGLDYGHGTGHGIGHALNVHEGPSSIKERYVPDDQGLEENMFTSNEPGYYKEGSFGVRLENNIRVVNVELPYNFQNQGFLGFEDLTFVPYQHKLIKLELLTDSEISYLNDYQEKCRSIVANYIREQIPSDPAYDWIYRETEPIG